jgi:predicted RNase H-like HicB family nuclease
MIFTLEHGQEDDGRWLVEVLELLGVLAYGNAPQEAIRGVRVLALRVLAERIEHGEVAPDMLDIELVAA